MKQPASQRDATKERAEGREILKSLQTVDQGKRGKRFLSLSAAAGTKKENCQNIFKTNKI